MNGRAEQYTLGERFLDYYYGCDDVNAIATFTVGQIDLFGGHTTTHSGSKPSLRYQWRGSQPFNIGNNLVRANVGSTSGNLNSATVTITPQEAAGPESLGRIFFPEISSESYLHIQVHCDVPPPYLELSGYALVARVRMLRNLSPVPDLVSADGLGTLNFQRNGENSTGVNSHGTEAAYATAANAAAAQALVNSYGDCSTHQSGQSYTLTSEATSITYGGLYDINKNWKQPHKNHRAGEDIDIGFNGLATSELECLYDAYTLTPSGYVGGISGEQLIKNSQDDIVKDGNHVHLWDRESDIYNLDQECTFAIGYINYFVSVNGGTPVNGDLCTQ